MRDGFAQGHQFGAPLQHDRLGKTQGPRHNATPQQNRDSSRYQPIVPEFGGGTLIGPPVLLILTFNLMVSANCLDEILLAMDQEKKVRRRELDLDAEALAALEQARAMQAGPERTAAMKKAGILRNAADLHGIVFARRGRPPKI